MTEVKHEYGYWIVFVNDDPKFSFIYREEAEIVAEMIDALIECHALIDDMYPADRNENHLRLFNQIVDALEKSGVEL